MANYPPSSITEEQEERRKVESVVTGKATIRKKTMAAKVMDMFFPEGISKVKDYILNDVLIPKLKQTVVESVDVFFNGEVTTRHGAGTYSKASYNDYSKYSNASAKRETRDPNLRSGREFDDIEFDTRIDAEAVLDQLDEIMSQYGIVRVADLYDSAHISNQTHTTMKFGWKDIRSAEVVRLRNGHYFIRLPRPLPID